MKSRFLLLVICLSHQLVAADFASIGYGKDKKFERMNALIYAYPNLFEADQIEGYMAWKRHQGEIDEDLSYGTLENELIEDRKSLLKRAKKKETLASKRKRGSEELSNFSTCTDHDKNEPDKISGRPKKRRRPKECSRENLILIEKLTVDYRQFATDNRVEGKSLLLAETFAANLHHLLKIFQQADDGYFSQSEISKKMISEVENYKHCNSLRTNYLGKVFPFFVQQGYLEKEQSGQYPTFAVTKKLRDQLAQ